MKFKEIIIKIKNIFLSIIRIPIALLMLFSVFWFFRWVGYKGMLSFILGLTMMAYLILSKSAILMAIIKMTESEWFINDMVTKKKDKQDKETKTRD